MASAMMASPNQPISRLMTVIPSCVPENSATISESRVSTSFARELPSLESCSRRVRRTLSRAYSVATKKALSATKPIINEALNKADMEHLGGTYCRRGLPKFQMACAIQEQTEGHGGRDSAGLLIAGDG